MRIHVRFQLGVLLGVATTAGGCVTGVEIQRGDRSWSHPAGLGDSIDPNGMDAYEPQLASRGADDTFVVWYQSDRSSFQVYESTCRDGAWEHPADSSDSISPFGQNAFDPKVAFGGAGAGVVVWYQNDGICNRIYKSEFRSGAWTHPAGLDDSISPTGETAYEPDVACDAEGNAVIVWRQLDGAHYRVFVSEYRSGAWQHPKGLGDTISPDGSDAFQPVVAFGGNGDAMIAWYQSDGLHTQIFVSEYRDGVWTHPNDLQHNISPAGTNAYQPDVALDADGNACVTWYQDDGIHNQIFKSDYRDGVWTHPVCLTDNISPDHQHAYEPRIEFDAHGGAVLVWYQSGGTAFQIMKSEYRGGDWVHPESLRDSVSLPGHSAYDASVAFGPHGSAIIVWYQDAGTCYQIFKAEYRGGVWVRPSAISENISPDGQDAYEPDVAFDGSGNAVIVWRQFDGARFRVFKSEYR